MLPNIHIVQARSPGAVSRVGIWAIAAASKTTDGMSSEPGFGVLALFFFHLLHLQPVSLALLPYKADLLSGTENGDLPSSSCTPCTRYVEVRQFLLDVI
jgi:hypothetical protein